MTTATDICTRAMRRLGLLDESEAASGGMLVASLAALNDMMHGWKALGVDLLHTDYTSASTVCFYLPPRAVLKLSTFDALDYQGTWDADANSPSLATSTGTEGHVYKVATAGSTTLDTLTDWTVNQFLTFDGSVWRRSPDWRPHERCLTSNLAVFLGPEYGKEAPATVQRLASQDWLALQGAFTDPRRATFDTALTFLPSARKEWY